MEINFLILIYSGIGLFLTYVCIFAARYITLRHTDDGEIPKIKKFYKEMNIIGTIIWILFVVFSFTLNPVIDHTQQSTVGITDISHEYISDTDKKKIIEEHTKAIKSMHDNNHKELIMMDKESEDDYNKFLNEIKK